MVLVALGTRPEVIKLCPVIREMQAKNIAYRILFTGQHRELFEDVQDLIPVPDYRLNIMERGNTLNDKLAEIVRGSAQILQELNPSLVIVQGDTSTVLGVALAAFNHQIPIGHVEAGLRSFDLQKPFPEEANRCMVTTIATLNWAPTKRAFDNLTHAGARNVILTGNTVVDAALGFEFPQKQGEKVLITLHRRENFGERMARLFEQIEQAAAENPELDFVFPMHPNPQVLKHRNLLRKVRVIKPLPYRAMMKLLSETRFVISDSGGIQEECAAFNKPILVCRDSTERPEGITAGFARLVGDQPLKHIPWALNFDGIRQANPYGDGKAANRIIQSIINHQYA
ncbi:MAG: UDP-N-acetylglucosamine 2-epimerase (non-hydrolyzing) [Bacteroidetes bacterium]|nr:UDP-N-acetylglucosamine 2-epimerase (non-hydrolyzing) [Bacteroidota bacterium]